MPLPAVAFFAGLPTWVKVGAAAGLIIGVLELRHWWTTRDLKRDLAKQEELLKQTQEESAKAAAQRELHAQQEEQNRKDQQAAIDRTNARISTVAAQTRQAEALAALAANRALKESEDAADALADPSSTVPVDPESLNAHLRKRFGVTP